jgi:hypothetical protein
MLLTLAIVWVLADAPALHDAVVAEPASHIAYVLHHKVHEVIGTANQELKVAVAFNKAQARLAVSTPVKRFDSANSRRDQTMLATVEAEKFPLVQLSGTIEDAVPKHFPTTVKRTLVGELSFHGVSRKMSVPVELVWNSATELEAKAKFGVSLEAHKIERPSLMTVKVDDALGLDVDLFLHLP